MRTPTSNNLSEIDVTATLERFTEPVVNRLIAYYETNITPIMLWLDSDQNGYRRFIVPLAASQPILRLAILVTAAKHATFDVGVDEDLLRSTSETAVIMITQRLTQLTQQDSDTEIRYDVDAADIEAIIAAVLVLSDYSLLRSNLSVAQFHREAVRTLIRTLMCTTSAKTELFRFLKDEAAGYDVLACTSLFEADRIKDAILPDAHSSMFGHFLRIVHAVTICSLGHCNHDYDTGGGDGGGGDSDGDLKHCPSSKMELENDFEAARGSTLLLAGPILQSQSETLRHDFIRLVAAYHHAGILYAYKRLPFFQMEETAHYHYVRLFEALEHMREIRVLLSSLTWPLFIAGICSVDDTERMNMVDNWCQLLATDTRYEHYNLLRRYLRELRDNPHLEWIPLAKQYESHGHPVVAI